MAKFAKGKYAFGFCDRTGFRYKIKDLDPRPDLSQNTSRRLSAFDPVGSGNADTSGNLVAHGQVGIVTVTT